MDPFTNTEGNNMAETIERLNSLYENFDDTETYLKNYEKKFDERGSFSYEKLNDEKYSSYVKIMKLLIDKKNVEIKNIISEEEEQLKKLHLFALSEIAHKKLRDIEFQIGNPFFFRKLRTEYRDLKKELEDLDNIATSDEQNNDLSLRFENLIERLRNVRYAIDDEKRSGLYSSILKAAVWGIPILIGVYQIIAMQYFVIDPYVPLIVYAIALFAIYLSLKSANTFRYIMQAEKGDKVKLITVSIIFFAIIVSIVQFSESVSRIFIILLSGLALFMLLFCIVGVDEIIEGAKFSMVNKELEVLIKRYNLKDVFGEGHIYYPHRYLFHTST